MEQQETKLRSAHMGDVPTIQAIAYAAWPEAFKDILSNDQIEYMLKMMYEEEVLERQLWVEGHGYLIAEKNGQPVGFCGFEHHKSDGATKVHKLYLLPDFKQQGIGRELLQGVERKAQFVGDKKVYLNVNKYNQAIDFYKQMGYQITKEEVIDIGNGYVMDDYVMEKKIIDNQDNSDSILLT
jgi:diamine N-acetyltransferase